MTFDIDSRMKQWASASNAQHTEDTERFLRNAEEDRLNALKRLVWDKVDKDVGISDKAEWLLAPKMGEDGRMHYVKTLRDPVRAQAAEENMKNPALQAQAAFNLYKKWLADTGRGYNNGRKFGDWHNDYLMSLENAPDVSSTVKDQLRGTVTDSPYGPKSSEQFYIHNDHESMNRIGADRPRTQYRGNYDPYLSLSGKLDAPSYLPTNNVTWVGPQTRAENVVGSRELKEALKNKAKGTPLTDQLTDENAEAAKYAEQNYGQSNPSSQRSW